MHPNPLDLPHGARQRTDLGLEHHLAALEAGERPAAGDQVGDARPVGRGAAVAGRVHPDFLGEHRDRRGQVPLQLVRAHRPHQWIRRHLRRVGERHERLLGAHLARRTPLRGDLLPERQHLLGRPDQRRAHAAAAQRTIGEGSHRAGPAPQRNQVRAREAHPGELAAVPPELAAEAQRVEAGLLDARGHHAGRYRDRIQYGTDQQRVAFLQ